LRIETPEELEEVRGVPNTSAYMMTGAEPYKVSVGYGGGIDAFGRNFFNPEVRSLHLYQGGGEYGNETLAVYRRNPETGVFEADWPHFTDLAALNWAIANEDEPDDTVLEQMHDVYMLEFFVTGDEASPPDPIKLEKLAKLADRYGRTPVATQLRAMRDQAALNASDWEATPFEFAEDDDSEGTEDDEDAEHGEGQ